MLRFALTAHRLNNEVSNDNNIDDPLRSPCLRTVKSTPVDKRKALTDLNVLQTSLEEIHPNIYRYTSRADFVEDIKRKKSIGDTITVRDFYNLVAPLIAMVRCGHTFGIAPVVDDKRGLLPLDVKIWMANIC